MSLSQLEFNNRNIATTFISGNAGDIETLISRPETISDTTPVIVISHPHPLYGGTMSNKVVTTLAKTFTEMNGITVRFNFRGVGKSEGGYADGIGEAEDLALIVNQLKKWRPAAPIWLAGFSFGAYVTLRAQRKVQVEKLLLVAPPVSMYPFDELDEVKCPWWVIQGGEDEVISAQEVKKWTAQRPNPPQLIWFDDASHFFHGKLIDLKDALIAAWNK